MGGVHGRCEREVCMVGVNGACTRETRHTHKHTTRTTTQTIRMGGLNGRCEWVVHGRFTPRRLMLTALYVEYVERGNKYGILFIFSLFCKDTHHAYVRIHVIYRVDQTEYGIHILVVAPQEYVNIYTCLFMCVNVYMYVHTPIYMYYDRDNDI